MLSVDIHYIYVYNRSPAPHTTRGAPNRIARHQRETYNKLQHNTTKARASSCERWNARPRSRSLPARPQTTTGDCPGHASRHGTTCPHAAAQTLPEAVAQTCALPAAPQLPIRRHRIVLPRGRPANRGCKLVCWFSRVRRLRAVRRSLGKYHAAHLCLLEEASEAHVAAALAVKQPEVGDPLRS
jgi:hypothetical protein